MANTTSCKHSPNTSPHYEAGANLWYVTCRYCKKIIVTNHPDSGQWFTLQEWPGEFNGAG